MIAKIQIMRLLLKQAQECVTDASLKQQIDDFLAADEASCGTDSDLVLAAEEAASQARGVFVKYQDFQAPAGAVGYVRKSELQEFLESGANWNSIGLDHPDCWEFEPPYDHLVPLFATQQAAPEMVVTVNTVAGDHDWRNMALQFDRHRMQAMGLISAVAAGNASAEDCAVFAAQAPVPGLRIAEGQATLIRALEYMVANIGQPRSLETRAGFESAEKLVEAYRMQEA